MVPAMVVPIESSVQQNMESNKCGNNLNDNNISGEDFSGGNHVEAIFLENISISDHEVVVSRIENQSHKKDLFADHLREIDQELHRFDEPMDQSLK